MESKAKREGEAAAVVGEPAVVAVHPSLNLAPVSGEGPSKQIQRPNTAEIQQLALPVPQSAAVRPDPPVPAPLLIHPSQCKSCSDASARLEALQVMRASSLECFVFLPYPRWQTREMAVSQREVAVAAKEALVTSEARLQRETQQTVVQQQQQLAADQARLLQLEKELSARSKTATDKEKTLQDRERALADRERESAAREAKLERERAAIERERLLSATAGTSAALMRRPSTAAAGVGAAGKTATELQLPRLQHRLMLEDTDDLPPPQPQRAAHVPQPPPPRSAMISEPSACPSSAAALGTAPRQPLPKRLAWNAGVPEQLLMHIAAHVATHNFICTTPMPRSQILKILSPPRQPLSASQTPGACNLRGVTVSPFTFHRRGRISALGMPDVNAQLSSEAFEA
jgi:hypothetical protein